MICQPPLKPWMTMSVMAWIVGVVGLANAAPLVLVQFSQNGGKSAATLLFQNADAGMIYDSGELLFDQTFMPAAQAVKDHNPVYSTNTLAEIMAEWTVTLEGTSGTAGVSDGWNAIRNGAKLEFTHSTSPGIPGFDYESWLSFQEDTQQSTAGVTIDFGYQFDHNGNHAFDGGYEQLAQNGTLVQDAFKAETTTGFDSTTDMNAIGILPEPVPLNLSGMTFGFASSTNMTYTVFSSTNLTLGIWLIETNFTDSGSSNSFEMIPLNSHRFYKVEGWE